MNTSSRLTTHKPMALCQMCQTLPNISAFVQSQIRQHHQLGLFQCSFPACAFTGEYKQKVYTHYQQQHKQTNCQHAGCQYQTSIAYNMKKHQLQNPFRKQNHIGANGRHDYASTERSTAIKHIRTKHFPSNTRSVPNGAQLDPKDYVEVVRVVVNCLSQFKFVSMFQSQLSLFPNQLNSLMKSFYVPFV